MKLLEMKASRYRSLRDERVTVRDLNLFIGANASGKSTILDALRFLHEGLRERDFWQPVFSRGGIVHLAWKGEEARQIKIETRFEEGATVYGWSVQLRRSGFDFQVHEDVHELRDKGAPVHLLSSENGQGWWWSGIKGDRVQLKQKPTECALSAAAADATFPARGVAEFVGHWGFFDPSPFLLRRGWAGLDAAKFDSYGRNLAERLLALKQSNEDAFRQIVSATQSVLGLPSRIEFREPRDSEERVYFIQDEPGLHFPVYQIGASSGTLRVLALMTALFGEAANNLIGIEEPENHVHPTALEAFAGHLLKARERVQLLVTTHSPLLLNFLGESAEAVCVVRRTEDGGTRVTREPDAAAVHEALKESGFGLGEFHETRGFGG